MRRWQWSAALASLLCLAAAADTLDSVTVVGKRRELVEQQVRAFVTHIALKPYETSMARWETVAPLCPMVAGLPREDGEYILARVSRIAAAARAPLAPEHCKPNLFIVVSTEPDALLKAWSNRDVRMFGDEADQGGGKIRKFLTTSAPIRAWYNAELYSTEGTPIGNTEGRTVRATATRLVFNSTRDLTSALVMVDSVRAKGVSFGQLASYIAMISLAEIRIDANVADQPSILRLFSAPPAEAPTGLSAWDEAFLKALYHTEHTDRQQLAEIKTEMVQDIAPLP